MNPHSAIRVPQCGDAHMRLQRLEINGFKSFSDRSELAFDRGVTAIVGPNGCGKSNVADAITWVMGELSAKSLRGDKMEDVIFSGSDARKPTAAAEVRLRFSGFLNGHTANGHDGNGHNGNGHGHGHGPHDDVGHIAEEIIESVAREVEVTRRLYRSGESEYLIDGQVCRLRDVPDLLMDTGLGAKAYAIIEQGKIAMILSTRPTDRRQLIEEAAGVTKYKARRRAAELKLEAARQNLTRIDDIVFEVEKQRGTLKRQAAKARRYQKLRDELGRWEKVLFARKYRQLADIIGSARARLGDARERESFAAAHVAEVEADLGRLRIELAEAESRATTTREAAHARELAITRQQQQSAFDREQVQSLTARTDAVEAELEALEVRREPARASLAGRREAAPAPAAGRGPAAARIARSARESELASARIEHEWRARSVRSREHELAGVEARLKSLEELEAARAAYGDAPRTVLAQANGKVNQQGAIADYLEVEAGYERAVEACLGDLLQHVVVEGPEHAAAGFQVVREADAGRCGFLITSAADGHRQGYGGPPKLHAKAEAGHHRNSGAGPEPSPVASGFGRTDAAPDGLIALSSIVRVNGPFAGAIRHALGDAWIAHTYAGAAERSALTPLPVATIDGDVFHGPHLVSGGGHAGARGILETKREIKELRGRIAADREALFRLAQETAELEGTIAHASHAIAALNAEHHTHEKVIVGREAQLQHATEEQARLAQKAEQLSRERRQAEEERDSLDRRQEEARASIARLDHDQRVADERLTVAQRHLFEAREATEDLSRRAAEARATHAALVERGSALDAEVRRLEEAAADLEQRAASLAIEIAGARRRIEELRAAIVAGEAQLDVDVRELDGLRGEVIAADDASAALRAKTDEHEAMLKEARRALESVRAVVSELDIARATAEGDLSHLAYTCEDAVHSTLDEVVKEIDALEREGRALPDATVVTTDEPEDDEAGGVRPQPEQPDADGEVGLTPGTAERVVAAEQRTLSAEEAIAALRGKIDRLGPVNMMAIEQFDELESRHTFLTTQRKDLVESIAQTSEAIKRIDETTRHRFNEAFAAINRNFQETFSTLFGGGRAGLTLLDENDPLESGIEIIAQPPGKRLQSVQLLSGGEKALTAIALMFGMFKYKPSPFCLLDEIDAPLDDANIGRFVEMLRGMQQHTQFIVITHNRKTMEIADRLYGVTMEEPGVSKLISVQLN